jgi:dolichol-phosphate mannosyltransferase
MTGISFFIPTYNEEGTIVSLLTRLKQVALQLGVPYEIVIVDDNSTDKTRELASALKDDLPLRIFSKNGAPRGKAYSLLLGFAQAR